RHQPGDVHRLRPLQRDRGRTRGQGPRRPAAAGPAGRLGPAPARAGHALRQPAGDDGRGRGQEAAGQRPRRGGADAAVLRRLRPPVRRGQPVARGRHPGHRGAGRLLRPGRDDRIRRLPAGWPHRGRPDGRVAALLLPPLRRAGRNRRLRRERARAGAGRARTGRRHHAHHHLPRRTRLADRDRRARRHLVPGQLPRTGGPAMSETQFTAEEQEWVDAFLAETTLFLGPDPEIMNDHRMAPRTAEEDRLLSGPVDANDLDRVRKRIIAGLDEAFEMMEQTGAAPGAKWGDLTSAVYSASGDLIHISTGGVLAFASVLHYPVRFINKYWIQDPTVGVHDGDAFIHNDARYGNIHNTDQSMILPVFYEGELIAWVATIIHEGENGAKEPGGMPSSSESAYDDGIRMSPFKIVEKGEIRRDLLTFLQNSVREPKLQYQDLKVKLYSALRIKERLLALVDEVGRDAFVVSLRKSLEDVEAEARRRIRELPDGTYRVNLFSDSTLRENVLLKYPCAITVQGDELIVDWRGAAPQIMNRAFNATLGTAKCGLNQAFLGFFWPDLPRGISMMNPIEVITDEGS